MSKKLKTVFTISIILNVLFIGLFIGHLSHRMSMHRYGDFMQTIKTFPEDKQELVFNTMKELKSNTKESKEKIKLSRDEIIETLTAPEFDPEKFNNQVKTLHSTFGELTSELANAIGKLAQNLNQEERIALAELIESRHKANKVRGDDWNKYWDKGVVDEQQ